jgi:hypothetical protein
MKYMVNVRTEFNAKTNMLLVNIQESLLLLKNYKESFWENYTNFIFLLNGPTNCVLISEIYNPTTQ